MGKKTNYNITVFVLFITIFAFSLITATMPTKTVKTEYSVDSNEPISIVTEKFNAQSLTEKPKYIIGLGLIALLSLGGVFLVRYSQNKIDEAEKFADDEKAT